MQYFLAITDDNGNPIAGGSGNARYPGWFNVEDIDLGSLLERTSGGAAAASASREGFEVDFQLTVMLASSAYGSVARLLAEVASGTSLDNVRLVGVDNTRAGSPVVMDLRLDAAQVTNFGTGTSLGLTFEAARYTLSTFGFDARGIRREEGTYSWEGGDYDTPPATAPASGSGGAMPTVTRYVMAIDGVNGGNAAAGRPGWFTLEDASFGLVLEQVLRGTNDAFLSPPQFSPIRVFVPGDEGLGALMQRTLTGATIPQIRIDGVNGAGGTTVYSVALAGVTVVAMTDAPGRGYELQLDFQRISVTTQVPGEAPVSTTYNRLTDTVGGSAIPAPFVPASTTTPIYASNFFIALSGIEGEAGGQRPGWFALDEQPTFTLMRPISAPGAVAAPIEVGQMTVQFSSLTALAELMAVMTSGSALGGATINGLTTGGGRVYAADLANVRIVELQQAGNTIAATLEFDRFDLVTWHRTAAGTTAANPAVSWNSLTGTAGDAVPSVTPPAGTVTAVNPEMWFLTLDGINGGSTVAGRFGTFQLDHVQFAIGAGGQAEFGRVSVTAFDARGQTAVLRTLFESETLSGARIEGVVNVNGQLRTVTRIELGDVRVAETSVNAWQGLGFDLAYDRIVTRTFDRDTGGVQSESGWDIVTGVPYTGSVDASPGDPLGSPGVAQSWYMVMNGIGGDATAPGHANWIRLASFVMDVQTQVQPGSGSTALDGGFVDIELSTTTAVVDFLDYLRFDSIGTAVIDGLDATGRIVSRLEFDGVTVARFAGSATDPMVRLSFRAVEVTTPLFNANGTSAGAINTGFDFEENNPTTVTPTATPVAAPTVLPSQFVMLVDGFNGDIQSAQRGGWFRVELGPVDLSRDGDDVQGAPITVYLSDLGSASGFAAAMASGRSLGGIMIEGVRNFGTAGERVVYRLSMQDVFVSSLRVVSDGVMMSLSYDALRVETWANQTGLVNDGYSVFSLDLATGASYLAPVLSDPAGTLGHDMLAGSVFANTLDGNAGDDSLFGLGGNDTLTGGAGNDSLDGGAGVDVASYAAAASRVEVSLAIVGAQNTRGGGIDQLTGIEGLIGSAFNDWLTGDGAGNTLSGGNGKDVLRGGGGADLLEGGDGADTLSGGAGDDLLVGGSGFDFASYADAAAGVRVTLASAAVQATLGAGNDRLQFIEGLEGSGHDDLLTGNGINNQLIGGGGNDRLDGAGGLDLLLGGDGSDTLIGGLGADTLAGGAGSDRFLFNSTAEGFDTITDFRSRIFGGEVDTLAFAAAAFGLPAGAISAAQFQKTPFTTTALTADVRFIFVTQSFLLIYDSNGNLGGGDVVLGQVLTTDLSVTDFLMV